jgi:hypothetical protein
LCRRCSTALGSSRQLQIGPGSTLSILVAASLSGLLVGVEPGEAVALAALLALISGVMLVAAQGLADRERRHRDGGPVAGDRTQAGGDAISILSG